MVHSMVMIDRNNDIREILALVASQYRQNELRRGQSGTTTTTTTTIRQAQPLPRCRETLTAIGR